MSLQNWFLLFILGFLWGTSFPLIELALEGFTPITLVFLRISFGGVLLFLWTRHRGHKLPKSFKRWQEYIVMGMVANVVPFILIAWGQTHITGSAASILNATTPIMTLILAHFLTQDERLTPIKSVGVLLGFTGIYVMMSPALSEGMSIQGWGQLAVVFAALCYACAGIWGKRFGDTPPSVNATCMLTCSSVILLPLIFIFEDPLSLTPTLSSSLSIAGLAILGTGIAYILAFRIIASAGASSLSLVTFLVPIYSTLLGVFALGEILHPTTLMGMGIILIGLVFVDGRILKAFK